ncbi:single-stranded DNA-binding protein [Anaerotignum propionicum]|uniref:single-stranded DNA-binding protein n=1 Tax=Anaerotignum propionicum TaxID=28446 RepID=UPI00289BA71D|nr:single-stranded DNA-binding protein [Anaerotignum propionicum]
MNKVELLGRLVKDPEVRYSQGGDPLAICRFTLAVNRRTKKNGQYEADFINCVSFGKAAEFSGKYFKKGQMIAVVGRIRVESWNDNEGKKRWKTEVVIEEQFFTGKTMAKEGNAPEDDGFYPIDEEVDDSDLPF